MAHPEAALSPPVHGGEIDGERVAAERVQRRADVSIGLRIAAKKEPLERS
jgi:hypothetical protein